jgi:hypothetical protein
MNTLIALQPFCNRLTPVPIILLKALRTLLTMRCHSIIKRMGLLLLAVISTTAHGQSLPLHPCMSSGKIDVLQSLQMPCGQYVSSSLEVLVETIRAESNVAIWCDRRIAKDTRVELVQSEPIAKETLEVFLDRVVRTIGCSLIPLDGILLIVPKDKQSQIEAADWKFVQSKSASRLSKAAQGDFRWKNASVAAEILASYFQTFLPGQSVQPKVEYDLWREFEFKKVPPASIGVCLFSGFDMCLVDEGGQVVVAGLDSLENVQVEWIYQASELRRIGTEYTQSWRLRWPATEVSKSGAAGNFMVRGTVESHRDLVRPLMALRKVEMKKPRASGYDKRLTGQLSGELEIIVRSLAAKTKLEFFPLPLPPQIGSKVVHVQLTNSTLEESLKLISKASGIEFRMAGGKVEILLKQVE